MANFEVVFSVTEIGSDMPFRMDSFVVQAGTHKEAWDLGTDQMFHRVEGSVIPEIEDVVFIDAPEEEL